MRPNASGSTVFIIEDTRHAEWQAKRFGSYSEAMDELRLRADLPWDEQPNVAPCKSWRTCGRRYEIIEFDTSEEPWPELERTEILDMSASGVRWLSARR